MSQRSLEINSSIEIESMTNQYSQFSSNFFATIYVATTAPQATKASRNGTAESVNELSKVPERNDSNNIIESAKK